MIKALTLVFKKYIHYVIMLVILGGYIWVANYAVYTTDDFSLYLNYGNSNIFTSLKWVYNNWQGTYFGILISAGLIRYLPLGHRGLQIEAVVTILLFGSSYLYLINNIINRIVPNLGGVVKKLICNVSLFFVLCTLNPSEIFYWNTGIAIYTIPLIMSFVTIGYVIKQQYDNYIVNIFMIICSFLSAGGSLQISGFLCSALLVTIIGRYLLNKNIILKDVIIFVAAIVGSIINVIAPGNYVRKGIGSELHILGSIKISIINNINLLWGDIQSGRLLLLVVMIAMVIIIMNKNLQKMELPKLLHPLIVFVLVMVVGIITDFPVELGYDCEELPIRGLFVERCVYGIGISVVIIVSLYNALCRCLAHIKEYQGIICLLLGLITVGICSNTMGVEVYTPIYAYNECINGDMLDYYEKSINIYEEIKNSNQQDVCIETYLPNGKGILCQLGLYEDIQWWTNKTIARFYGKNSVSVKDLSN